MALLWGFREVSKETAQRLHDRLTESDKRLFPNLAYILMGADISHISPDTVDEIAWREYHAGIMTKEFRAQMGGRERFAEYLKRFYGYSTNVMTMDRASWLMKRKWSDAQGDPWPFNDKPKKLKDWAFEDTYGNEHLDKLYNSFRELVKELDADDDTTPHEPFMTTDKQPCDICAYNPDAPCYKENAEKMASKEKPVHTCPFLGDRYEHCPHRVRINYCHGCEEKGEQRLSMTGEECPGCGKKYISMFGDDDE